MSRRLRWPLLVLVALGALALKPSARATTQPVSVRGNPLERFVLSDGTPRTLTGRVVERLRAGSYAYLRVRTDAGDEHWVAALALGLPAGEAVAVKVIADAPTFESRRLSRTFSPLLFGVVRAAPPPKFPESK